MTELFTEEATTKRTVRNIRRALKRQLESYDHLNNITKEEKDELLYSIMKIHGMAPENFDSVGFMEHLINGRLNDISVDANSNKQEKTIAGIHGEATKAYDKAVGYDFLYRQLVKDWGKKEAKRLSGLMYDLSLGLSDSTKILQVYCYAVDSTKLVIEGRPWGAVHSKPPQSMSSYVSALNETAHQLGSHLAGAIAFGTLFLDSTFVLLFRQKMGRDEIKTDRDKRKYIQNCFQSLVHSVNHLSRNASESIFTNVSIFDKPKLEKLIAEDNMWWFFEMGMMESGIEYTKEEIIETIMDVQDIYTDFVDAGDPTKNGMVYPFPVNTLNFTKEQGQIVDQPFLEKALDRDIHKYNIFTSKGSKVASCCFRGDQDVEWFDNPSLSAKREVTSFESLYAQRAYGGEDTFVITLKDENYLPSKCRPIRVPYTDDFLEITFTNKDMDSVRETFSVVTTKDHSFPIQNNEDVKAENLKIGMTQFVAEGFTSFVVESVRIVPNESGYAYCIEMEDSSNPYFYLPSGLLSHNCRLINDTELMELGAETNSFGGTQVSLGSHRVNTINSMRIALQANSDDHFLEIYSQRISDAAKILKSHKNLIKYTESLGLQPFITNGWVRLDRLFSTIGILGMYEASQTMEAKFGEHPEGKDREQLWLDLLNEKLYTEAKEHGIIMNAEQIPAESYSVRLCKTDKLLFGDSKVPYKLYANQWTPLWVDATLYERMAKDGKYNQSITGGGILHLTVDTKPTKAQNRALIEQSVASGCEHFALNGTYAFCENEHTTFGRHEVCPICGSKIIEKVSRPVGFFTKVSSWVPERRDWEYDRRKVVDFKE